MIVYIMRGLPGSGKSTVADKLADHVFSTDDYFMVDGAYRFDRERLSEAHQWNRARFREAVFAKIPTIVVDNTNIKPWEWEPYETLARQHGYKVKFLLVDEGLSDEELAARNTHGVPVGVICSMRARLREVAP